MKDLLFTTGAVVTAAIVAAVVFVRGNQPAWVALPVGLGVGVASLVVGELRQRRK